MADIARSAKPWDEVVNRVEDFDDVVVQGTTDKFAKKISKGKFKDSLAFDIAGVGLIEGGTLAAPTVLPAPSATGEKVYKAGAGYFSYDENTFEAPVGKDWYLLDNGSSWSLKDMGALPTIPMDGDIKSGETRAVDGDKVYKYLNPEGGIVDPETNINPYFNNIVYEPNTISGESVWVLSGNKRVKSNGVAKTLKGKFAGVGSFVLILFRKVGSVYNEVKRATISPPSTGDNVSIDISSYNFSVQIGDYWGVAYPDTASSGVSNTMKFSRDSSDGFNFIQFTTGPISNVASSKFEAPSASFPNGTIYFDIINTNEDAGYFSVLSEIFALKTDIPEPQEKIEINKSIVFMGDSITWMSNQYDYVARILAKINFKLVQRIANSGATWTNLSNTVFNTNVTTGSISADNTIWNQINKLKSITDLDSSKIPDVIFISAGTNDYGSSRPLGDVDLTFTGSILDRDANTILSVSDAVKYNCELLMSYYPQATIIIATPLQRGVSDISSLINYCSVIESSANRMSIMAKRQDKEVGIYGFNEIGSKHTHLYDGLHQNTNGAIKIASYWIGVFKNLL